MDTNTAQADYLKRSPQPGIWAHSYNDDEALTHQYLVSYTKEGMLGKLAIKSFRNAMEALEYVDSEQDAHPGRQYTITNQFA